MRLMQTIKEVRQRVTVDAGGRWEEPRRRPMGSRGRPELDQSGGRRKEKAKQHLMVAPVNYSVSGFRPRNIGHECAVAVLFGFQVEIGGFTRSGCSSL